MESLNTLKIKKMNTNKVFKYIYENKTVNKVMICNEINMCLSTVNQNLKVLEESNLIIKIGNFESTGGRKADQLAVNKDFRYSIGIALLRDKINFVLTNLYLEIVYKETINIAYENNDTYYKNLSSLLEDFINNNSIDRKLILGVSIATQGIVVNGIVKYGPIMNNEGMSLDSLSKYIKYNLYLEHDSKCAAALSLWNHSIENGYVFLLNDNLGSAVILNKNIATDFCGTIEHTKIMNNSNLCYCGKKGCLETICSVNSLERMSNLDIDSFFKELRNGNKDINDIWLNFLNTFAYLISNLDLVISGKYILTGVISKYFNEADLIYLHNSITEYATFDFDKSKIITSEYGEYTQAVGATLYFINEFIKKI